MTAGTAILIEGDTDYWFESGAVCDMDIHDNLFENCGTSASNNGGSGWGEALISITPSFRPADETARSIIAISGSATTAFSLMTVRCSTPDRLRDCSSWQTVSNKHTISPPQPHNANHSALRGVEMCASPRTGLSATANPISN